MSFLVIIGNPRPHSRTATAAVAAARAVADAAGLSSAPETIDLSDLAPRLLAADPGPDVAAALERVAAADVLLIASPTYKGTYTGLLKSFLDRLPGGALTGKVALPLLVLGAPQHALAVEVHLRPLLVELGATVPTPGLALLESDLDRLDSVTAEWAGRVASAARGALRAEASR
ncbi:NADPH-dependent oxidoreductase [Actinomadura rayongensis]|uniref:NADPH-dependent oxidoreductase n=1 Tax=Actinomadura rayongensis TaxID=1429076 RepID=A0A6I4W8N1_9ACTN|nr:NADPH-dependent oxidoreductase [Actinomadura rayongensis]